MRIIKAGFEILPHNDMRGGLKTIEMAARTCYKSEDKMSENSAEAIVRSLIKNQHEAMLEHGDYTFEVRPATYEAVCRTMQRMRNMGYSAPRIEMSCNSGRPIVSGNIRAWRELLKADEQMSTLFIGHIDPIYTEDCDLRDTIPNPLVKRIHYDDISDAHDRETHIRQTVKFIIDRGVSHEFVRHRPFSFAQESTRYCNYQKNKFGNTITFISPCYWQEDAPAYKEWEKSCRVAEAQYFRLLSEDMKPERARAVLPNSLKTELVMTGTLRHWKHFFNLRALAKTGEPHPQAKEVALPVCEYFCQKWPEVFLDD